MGASTALTSWYRGVDETGHGERTTRGEHTSDRDTSLLDTPMRPHTKEKDKVLRASFIWPYMALPFVCSSHTGLSFSIPSRFCLFACKTPTLYVHTAHGHTPWVFAEMSPSQRNPCPLFFFQIITPHPTLPDPLPSFPCFISLVGTHHHTIYYVFYLLCVWFILLGPCPRPRPLESKLCQDRDFCLFCSHCRHSAIIVAGEKASSDCQRLLLQLWLGLINLASSCLAQVCASWVHKNHKHI